MSFHRATLVALATLFPVGMTSLASACCNWGAGRLCGGRAGDVWRLRCADGGRGIRLTGRARADLGWLLGRQLRWRGLERLLGRRGVERLGRWLRLLWRLRRVLRPWFCRFTGPGERRRPALRRAFLF